MTVWSRRSMSKVLEMRRTGMSLSQIGSYFGRSGDSIEGLLRRTTTRRAKWVKI